MGATARRMRRLAGSIAVLLMLLVQASTLAAAVRPCGRAGAADASALSIAQTYGGHWAERAAGPLPEMPADPSDAHACASAAALPAPMAAAATGGARLLPDAPAGRTLWTDPFLHLILRPPRA